MADEDVWFGDEEDEELPVLSPGADLGHPDAPKPPAHRRRLTPSRGVPTSAVPDARRQIVAEATGRSMAEPDAWRTEMELGRARPRRRVICPRAGGATRPGSGWPDPHARLRCAVASRAMGVPKPKKPSKGKIVRPKKVKMHGVKKVKSRTVVLGS